MWKADAMPMHGSLTRWTAVLVLALGLATSACSKDDQPTGQEQTPQQVMEQAKKTLDETSGVQLDLASTNLPSDVSGILSGTGIGTHPPAFEGSIKVQAFGASFDVPVVAVHGKVYAVKPLTTGYSVIDPADYGAPDPAALFSTTKGISSFLTATLGLAKGGSVRGGPDNREILTEYTGTLPASVVTRLIPSATGADFDAAYTVTDSGELREATLTGEFYPGAGDVTYKVTLTDYGVTKDITAP